MINKILDLINERHGTDISVGDFFDFIDANPYGTMVQMIRVYKDLFLQIEGRGSDKILEDMLFDYSVSIKKLKLHSYTDAIRYVREHKPYSYHVRSVVDNRSYSDLRDATDKEMEGMWVIKGIYEESEVE